jgi:hypothetical protein
VTAGGAGEIRGTRTKERREGKDDLDSGEVIELSGRVFENTRDLAGVLLRAKNVGITEYHVFDACFHHYNLIGMCILACLDCYLPLESVCNFAGSRSDKLHRDKRT